MYLKVKEFKRKYKVSSECSLEEIKNIIHQLGCNLSPYSENITKLIALNLDEEISSSLALSVMGKDETITVFYDDTLSASSLRFVLAHEIGHIVFRHIQRNLKGEKQERAADKFAQYLLMPNQRLFSNTIINLCLVSLCIVAILCNITIHSIIPSKSTRRTTINNSVLTTPSKPGNISTETSSILGYDETDSHGTISNISNYDLTGNKTCYFTPRGEVYHLSLDCYYIKNSAIVLHGTINESGKNRLCSACERSFLAGKDEKN